MKGRRQTQTTRKEKLKTKAPARARLHELTIEHNLISCVQCGKCSSACTMADVFEDFEYSWTPRKVIHDALVGRDLLRASSVWFCLACDVCESMCPSGVRFKDFIESLRDLIVSEGRTRNLRYCKKCGRPLLPRHTLRHVQQMTMDYTPDLVHLCSSCRRRIIGDEFKKNLRAGKKVSNTWRRSGRRASRIYSKRVTS